MFNIHSVISKLRNRILWKILNINKKINLYPGQSTNVPSELVIHFFCVCVNSILNVFFGVSALFSAFFGESVESGPRNLYIVSVSGSKKLAHNVSFWLQDLWPVN